MKLYNMIKYDFINGLLHKSYKYLMIFVLSIIFFVDFFIKIYYYTENYNISDKEETIINYLFYIFQGIEPYNPGIQSKFNIPVIWLIVFLTFAYFTMEYPFQNLTEHGIQVIIRNGSRKVWWVSKCIWIIINTLICFIVLYTTILFMSFIFGVNISFGFSEYINSNLLDIMFVKSVSKNDLIQMLVISPIITAISINFIQHFISLFIKRIYAFFIIAILLFASSYYKSPVLIGNFAMVKRNSLYLESGLLISHGIVINILIIMFVILIGLVFFNKHNILKRD